MEAEKLYLLISRLRKLDYRRFKRLKPKEKKIYTSSKLYPYTKCLALRYKSIIHCTLEEALTWAKHNRKRYDLWLSNPDNAALYRYERYSKYLEQEFLFRGYVPINKFKKKPECNYLESNQPINGIYYIYPGHFTNGGLPYPNVYQMQGLYGIGGFTKVDIKYS